jgi:putative tryptophan/tyrosine transport system substrate-binding protein
MRRREFITLVGGIAATWPRTVIAQGPSRLYRVGTLNTAAPVADNSPFGAGFVSGLLQHGYTINKNLMFERRGADMQIDRLPRLVDELVG